MSEKKYTLTQAMRDYDLKKLALGMESTLLKKIDYKKIPVCDGDKNDADIKLLQNKDIFGPTDDLCLLKSDHVKLNRKYEQPHKVCICFDEKYGELLYASCDCVDFSDNHFTCDHIHGMLMSYFLDEEEHENLKDTELYEELRRITGVEDPFLPGILRKTDESLHSFTKLYADRNKGSGKAVWITDPKSGIDENLLTNPEKSKKKKSKKASIGSLLSAECILSSSSGRVSVELKAGPERHYVIRHQEEFLEAYGENRTFLFGKNNTVLVGRNHFVKESAKIVDYFYKLYKGYQRMDRDGSILPYIGSDRRYFMLEGRELEAFMDLLDGSNITVQDYKGSYCCHVDFQREPEKIQIKKEAYGATLKLQDETAIGCGIDWMYFRQGQYVLRLPIGQWEQRKPLIDAGMENKELYVQDKDLPAICTTIQNMDPGMNQVEFQDMLPEEYIPATPQMQIYLDYPQEGLISCEMYAFYENDRKKYNIFDQRKGKKKRNFQLEQQAGQKLWSIFNAFDENDQKMYLQCDEEDLYIFLTETIPVFSEVGEVFISDQMKRLRVRPAGEVTVGLQVEAGTLLMSLQSNMMDRKDMMEILSSYDRRKRYTRLRNGEFLTFDEKDVQMWEMLSETYRNYGKKNPEAMKIPLFRALYINEMLENRDSVSIDGDDEYRNLVSSLEDESSWDYKLPDSLKDVMRGYQKEGFRWIKMLKSHGFGGILADDMGLGKTLQLLSFLLSEKEEGKKGDEIRTLIITPASLVYNWKKEIETFTPQLNCQIIAGSVSERRELIRGMKDGENDIFITSYDLLKRDIAEYEDIVFANEIIDEAQFIKNQNTQASKGVRLVHSTFRMALTGTPIENRLSELWSIFDYLMPGFLYRYNRFRKEYEAPVIHDGDEEVMDRLRKMVHPFILRRLKKGVLKDLPDKLEEIVTVQLEGEQRKVYDAYAERLRLFLEKQNLEEFQNGKLEILAELTKLRQICCGPEVFLEKYRGENAKKEACMELIHQAIDGGHKLLLFSQFTSVLDELCTRLTSEKISYHRIDGSTKKENRMEMVNSFETDEVPVFCISLKAGGTGLNLTAADIVIHYDPWWNVAAQNQATDRTHRIGQKNTVVVYQLIAEHTVEQQIVRLQQEKAKLAEDVLSGEGIASILIDKDELLSLL